jgi:hypothetical protein
MNRCLGDAPVRLTEPVEQKSRRISFLHLGRSPANCRTTGTSATATAQLGFNWKGDRHQPLFAHGSKAEMTHFIEQGTAADWDITAIGIAEREGTQTVFRDRYDRNVARDDSLGEFVNRPIFIVRSRHVD